MRKLYNFSAGPAMLPEEVLRLAQAEMLDWHGLGMSIMEVSHRGSEFAQVAEQAEADLRHLMAIPANYQVLFVPGGASAQFAMVPLNLYRDGKPADYIDTGIWSKKAISEAKRYGEVNVVDALQQCDGMIAVKDQTSWQLQDDACYVHYTPNETIDGVEFNWVPQTKSVPLVADMSSMILSRPIEVSQYGLIYAGAQKNLGQAGVTLVIVRDDLIGAARPMTPTLYQYKIHADNRSFYNTPPTYSWYLTGLVLAWMRRHGGVTGFYELNKRKAKLLYDYIDQSDNFYFSTVHPNSRSLMNVVFNIRDEKLIPTFLTEATAAGLTNLRGHRLVGGMRASLYNAMPIAGVEALVDFMRYFNQRNG